MVRVEGRGDLLGRSRRLEAAAWSYEQPTPGFEAITGFLTFYPARFECPSTASACCPRRAASTAAGSPPTSSARSRAVPGRWAGDSPPPVTPARADASGGSAVTALVTARPDVRGPRRLPGSRRCYRDQNGSSPLTGCRHTGRRVEPGVDGPVSRAAPRLRRDVRTYQQRCAVRRASPSRITATVHTRGARARLRRHRHRLRPRVRRRTPRQDRGRRPRARHPLPGALGLRRDRGGLPGPRRHRRGRRSLLVAAAHASGRGRRRGAVPARRRADLARGHGRPRRTDEEEADAVPDTAGFGKIASLGLRRDLPGRVGRSDPDPDGQPGAKYHNPLSVGIGAVLGPVGGRALAISAARRCCRCCR